MKKQSTTSFIKTNKCLFSADKLTESKWFYGIIITVILFELNTLVKIVMNSMIVLQHFNYIMNGALRWVSHI